MLRSRLLGNGTHCLTIWGTFKIHISIIKSGNTRESRVPDFLTCTLWHSSLFSVSPSLLLAWIKENTQSKESIREHLWGETGDICFCRGRICHQAESDTSGESYIAPLSSDASGKFWRILCTWVSHWRLEQSQQGGFCKGNQCCLWEPNQHWKSKSLLFVKEKNH